MRLSGVAELKVHWTGVFLFGVMAFIGCARGNIWIKGPGRKPQASKRFHCFYFLFVYMAKSTTRIWLLPLPTSICPPLFLAVHTMTPWGHQNARSRRANPTLVARLVSSHADDSSLSTRFPLALPPKDGAIWFAIARALPRRRRAITPPRIDPQA
jgi:hypothetical protein